MIGSAFQRGLVVRKYRECIRWKPLFAVYPLALLGLVIGIYFLKQASTVNPETVKQIFGVIILLAVAQRVFLRIEPREKVPFCFGAAAAFFSGILNGFANIGGPPMILWVLAHKWSKDRLRVTIPAFTLLLLPFQTVLLTVNFGFPVLFKICTGVFFIPVFLMGVVLGNLVSERILLEKVRLIIIILLALSGLSYTVTPFFL